jgi:hypothetical protein
MGFSAVKKGQSIKGAGLVLHGRQVPHTGAVGHAERVGGILHFEAIAQQPKMMKIIEHYHRVNEENLPSVHSFTNEKLGPIQEDEEVDRVHVHAQQVYVQ